MDLGTAASNLEEGISNLASKIVFLISLFIAMWFVPGRLQTIGPVHDQSLHVVLTTAVEMMELSFVARRLPRRSTLPRRMFAEAS